jgi:hypothetical protein
MISAATKGIERVDGKYELLVIRHSGFATYDSQTATINI